MRFQSSPVGRRTFLGAVLGGAALLAAACSGDSGPSAFGSERCSDWNAMARAQKVERVGFYVNKDEQDELIELVDGRCASAAGEELSGQIVLALTAWDERLDAAAAAKERRQARASRREPPPAPASPPAEPSPEPASPPPPDEPATPPSGGSVVDELWAYLREEFGGGAGYRTSWFGNIKGLSAPSGWDGRVRVETNLGTSSTAVSAAESICIAVATAGGFGIEVAGARVMGAQGDELAVCP